MTEYQRLFLVQARSSFDVYQLLRKTPGIHACHVLHYFQMATELLGKAHSWKNDPPNVTSHRSFVGFIRSLSSNRKAQQLMELEGLNASWNQMIRKSVPFAQEVETLAPQLAKDGPNPEYPWPPANPQTAPVEHTFEIWETLTGTVTGRKFLDMVGKLFASAEEFL